MSFTNETWRCEALVEPLPGAPLEAWLESLSEGLGVRLKGRALPRMSEVQVLVLWGWPKEPRLAHPSTI